MAQNNEVKRMRASLNALRTIAGWSQEDLGAKLGLSRVSVVSLPKHMNLVYYYAIRYLLMEQIKRNHDDILDKAVSVLLDDDELSDSTRSTICNNVEKSRFAFGAKQSMRDISLEARIRFLKMCKNYWVE